MVKKESKKKKKKKKERKKKKYKVDKAWFPPSVVFIARTTVREASHEQYL